MGALFGGRGGESSAATNVAANYKAVADANAQIAQQQQAATQQANFAAQQQQLQQQFQQQLEATTTKAQPAPTFSSGGFFGALANRNSYLGSGPTRNTFLGG